MASNISVLLPSHFPQEAINILREWKGMYGMKKDDKKLSQKLNEGKAEAKHLTIGGLIFESNATAQGHGWWEGTETFPEKIALIHTEVSEALEAFREGAEIDEIYYPNAQAKPEGVAAELADALIRIFDICGQWEIPLEDALLAKLPYNRSREYRHGGKKV